MAYPSVTQYTIRSFGPKLTLSTAPSVFCKRDSKWPVGTKANTICVTHRVKCCRDYSHVVGFGSGRPCHVSRTCSESQGRSAAAQSCVCGTAPSDLYVPYFCSHGRSDSLSSSCRNSVSQASLLRTHAGFFRNVSAVMGAPLYIHCGWLGSQLGRVSVSN